MKDSTDLLVKVRGDGRGFAAAAKRSFGAASDVEPLFRVPARKADPAFGISAAEASTWFRVGDAQGENPWDAAHTLTSQGTGFGADVASKIEAVEPDFEQKWTHGNAEEKGDGPALAADKPQLCVFDDQDTGGGKAVGPRVAWNLAEEFGGLASAREKVGDQLEKVIIAHLDTGYDSKHQTLPVSLLKDLQRSFVKADPNPKDATDKTPPGMELVRNRGHGTGTLSLLAGNRLNSQSPGWPGFDDFVGCAALAQVIPIRIADWVIRFTTGTMVQGFNYAREKGAHVLSMSMGGLSSAALVDAVNLAYEAGIVLVTAAGNNIAGLPTPRSIVFPARYRRVLAACGVMADGRAYAGLRRFTMQGNFGPASKMETAIGAYTPNVHWAQIDCSQVVDMDGAGTSSATPQVAAAAALWIAHHFEKLGQYPEPWMRVEAVRHALFSTARKSTSRMGTEETRKKIGQGVCQALAALAVDPLPWNQLRKLPPAEPSWSWLNLFLGGGVSLAPGESAFAQRRAMIGLELTQLAQRVRAVDEAIDDPERRAADIPVTARNRYLEAALNSGICSKPLQALLESMLGRAAAVAVPATAVRSATTVKRKLREPDIPPRRLRAYALDPSIAKSLDSMSVNETILAVPWDDQPLTREPLRPGPVGEYLEVVDVDPASNRAYEPVDLNDKKLLAQDGWPPSEGNPQFHQQMVYAVGMTTICQFEQALGRRALWAPRYVRTDDGTGDPRVEGIEVPRLRIYPHALRARNAYYSPDKKALLFGYFPAESRDSDTTAPGSMVFTCLSSDIIAHEMTHALLDGLHRRFQEASNPDVPAFHEAFADIVALFQHFMITDLVRFEIGKARGDLTVAGLLGGLAKQFGEGSSRSGPLRNYLDPAMRDLNYMQTLEAHDRGSILVFAVYEAFLKAVAHRTDGTIRLATGGSGVLPAGSLHPGLVDRLTEETCRAARYVLQMCIRALDYCPAVDITFGEYLRAVITADRDLVRDDRYGHRVAFMEAFRNRGILPRDVRTVSEETLAWGTLDDPSPKWLAEVLKGVDLRWDQEMDRSAIFELNEKNRWRLWNGLKRAFAQDPMLYAQFGLLPGLARYNGRGEVVREAEPDESTFDVFSVRPARRVAPDGSFRTELIAVINQRRPEPLDGKDPANGWFWFRGGATLVIDTRESHQEVRYSIIKNTGSTARLERQRLFASEGSLTPLRALYFGGAVSEPFAIMHADLGDRHHG